MTINTNAIGPIFAETSTKPKFQLGTIMSGDEDDLWMYVRASAAITGAGYVVVVDTAYLAAMATNALALYGMPVGVAPVAFAANDYGWVQVRGLAQIQVLGSCAANVKITSTTTAGALDDAAGTGTKTIVGIALSAARAASQGNAPGYLGHPRVDATNP